MAPAPGVDDNPSSGRCFWPADLLARDFPDVRVLTYGYESQVARFFSTLNLSTITQHSQDLLSRLTSERHEYPERPLIFIAHSLGGLLVKGALNESALHQPDDPQRRISRECRMVMFFGTPHRGSDFAQWGSALANIAGVLGFSVNTRIVQNLARESEILQRLERDFEGIIAQRDALGRKFMIYTFQEAKAVGGPLNKQVVSDSSSHYNRRDVEVSFRINDNHMDMCRFKGAGDENYKVIKKELVQYLKPIRESKNTPLSILDYRAVRRDSRVETQGTNTVEQYLQALGLSESVLPAYQARSPQEVTQPEVDLSWFSEHPDFETWDQKQSSAIIWLGSKTLKENGLVLSYLWKQRLSRAADGRSEVTIYHPLPPSDDCPPIEEHKTDSVVLIARNLIAQLLSQNFDRIHYIIRRYPYEEFYKDLSKKYAETEQRNLAAKVAFKILLYALIAEADTHVSIIVSGIDDLGTEKYRLIECLWNLHDALKKRSEPLGVVVKTVFTSRPIDTSQAATGPWGFLPKIPYIEKDKEANDCLQSLRVVNFDYSKRFNSVFRAGEDTGSWLWTNEDYMAWREVEASSLLLIEGKPGSGKSTLVKRILNTLLPDHQTMDNEMDSPLVAYFFYSYRGGALETSHQVMLQSILYQLLRQELTKLYPLFRKIYRRRLRHGIHEWEMKDLVEILNSLQHLNLGKRVFIFLDGMDESESQTDGFNWRSSVLDLLMNICSNSTCIIKTLVATRPLRQKDMGTRQYGSRSLQFRMVLQELNWGDIEALVTEELEEITYQDNVEDGLPQSQVDDLKIYIMENAAGVFAWVSLVLSEVKLQHKEKGLSPDELERLQEMLPPELGDLYKRIVKRLNENTPKPEQELATAEARKLLMCVSFARRPFTLHELRDLFAVPSVLEPGSEYNINTLKRKRNMAFERRIRHSCGDLLSVTGSYVQLFHETVRDFLLNEERSAEPLDIEHGTSNLLLYSICLRYLMISLSQTALEAGGLDDAATSVDSWTQCDYEKLVKLLDDRPFLAYAIKYLQAHKLEAEAEEEYEGSEEYTVALACLKAEFNEFESAMQKVNCSHYILGENFSYGQISGNSSFFRIKALATAATNGQTTAMRVLIELGTDIDTPDGERNILPLFTACDNRRTEAVKILLENGANYLASDEYGETALHKAALNGEKEIFSLLLQNGAYIEAENIDMERPLHLAAGNGHLSLVKQLLEAGCDVNCSDRYGGTPLHKATANRHVEVARALLENKADSWSGGEYRGTPLHRAVDQGHVEMVQLLLEYDASVNWESSYGGTPLHSAAASGQVEIMTLLLEKYGDITAKDHYGYTPLMWATMNRHDKIVELLENYEAVDSDTDTADRPIAPIAGSLFGLSG
ncbi:uncharacterized protein BDV14DRAFT_204051 [Aspergillus stella-maris]|uniref:uncharacterized protein n=1 Tax=Aspergillus stella-maris TaxID=1810926 RepID=UPI003CCDA1AE